MDLCGSRSLGLSACISVFPSVFLLESSLWSLPNLLHAHVFACTLMHCHVLCTHTHTHTHTNNTQVKMVVNKCSDNVDMVDLKNFVEMLGGEKILLKTKQQIESESKVFVWNI